MEMGKDRVVVQFQSRWQGWFFLEVAFMLEQFSINQRDKK